MSDMMEMDACECEAPVFNNCISRKVSFDFDGTLTRIDVQRYARLLYKEGYEVHIVTSRHKRHDLFDHEHVDLYTVAAKIGIDEDNIHFLNCSDKSTFFIEHPDFLFHLDDDWFVVDDINEHCKVLSICVLADGWTLRCDDALEDRTLENTKMLTTIADVRNRINDLVKSRQEKDIIPFLELVKQDVEQMIKNKKK